MGFKQTADAWLHRNQWLTTILLLSLIVVPVAWLMLTQEPRSTNERAAQERPAVVNSAWDGSVRQVERWLKRNVHDPKSLDFVEWGQVQRTANGYSVWVTYRAANAFGGVVMQRSGFDLDEEGQVVAHTPLN